MLTSSIAVFNFASTSARIDSHILVTLACEIPQSTDAILCDLGAFHTICPQLDQISSRYESQVFAAFIEIQRAFKSQPCSNQRLLFEIIPSCDAVSVERVVCGV